MIIEFLKAVLFGIVEGVTEWLPVSSTGHIILPDELLRLNPVASLGSEFQSEFMEMFEVVIQLGAIFAVLVVFFSRLYPFSSKKDNGEKKATLSLWLKVAVASIPAAFAGIVLDKVLEEKTGRDIDGWLYNAFVVAAALIVYGVLFIIVEKFNKNRECKVLSVDEISYKNAFFIGVFQMLAIIPGTSRSGSTILGSMCIGLSRVAATEFSFFLAIPAMFGASAIKVLGFLSYVSGSGISIPASALALLLVGMAVAFFVSFVTIKFLMDFVKKHSFSSFGIYRMILGVLVLLCFNL